MEKTTDYNISFNQKFLPIFEGQKRVSTATNTGIHKTIYQTTRLNFSNI